MPDPPRQWTPPDLLAVSDAGARQLLGIALKEGQKVQDRAEQAEARLREVEAERDRWRSQAGLNADGALEVHDTLLAEVQRAEAQVSRLEADLQEASSALQWIETRLSRHREPRVEAIDKALERARGVLRKGDTDAG